MILRPPRSTPTDTSFPTRRSSDLLDIAEAVIGEARFERLGAAGAGEGEAVGRAGEAQIGKVGGAIGGEQLGEFRDDRGAGGAAGADSRPARQGLAEIEDEAAGRSEEHKSEIQSLMRNSYAVFC